MSKTGRELLADMGVESTEMKIERLEKQNAALLAVCKELIDEVQVRGAFTDVHRMARCKAIVKEAEAPAESVGGG